VVSELPGPEPRPASSAAGPAGDRAARIVAWIVGFALIINLAVLPLYGYQQYSYRHYMAFGLPLLWLVCGRAASLLGTEVIAGARRTIGHVAGHRALYILAAVALVVAVNVGVYDADASWMFGRVSRIVGPHWLGLALTVAVVLLRRSLVRPPWFPRLACLAFVVVFIYFRPYTAMKRLNLVWRAADENVWDVLRERRGIVASFALQGEVAWNTGRNNIEAPEWPMHLYSFAFDHKLAIEDVYIESAAALLSPFDGPFVQAAPGFEGYARLQRWHTLPGYDLAFHSESNRGYPRFRVKPHAKASTDFRLSDPVAVSAIGRSPNRIELGDPAQVIYTAHGWASYYKIDDKSVVAGTDITRSRYGENPDAPYEDAGITFFLDQRRPSSVDLEIYAPAAATYHWYWNLDLYAYDRPRDRPAHAVGTYIASQAGWQRVHLAIPPGVTRAGLNKLGFRTAQMQPTVLCPAKLSDDACAEQAERFYPYDPRAPDAVEAVVIRPGELDELEHERVTMFVHSIAFNY
jgi:hypothetical protein